MLDTAKKIRIAVVILSIMLMFGLADVVGAVVTSDSAGETVISIYKNNAEDSEPFKLGNMLPGDNETKTYRVEVSHKGTVTVRFHADIHPDEKYKKLAEVLQCRVVLRGESEPLYDGLMRDMPDIEYPVSSVSGSTTRLDYDITVYLDTSVGNEYMGKDLGADFRWWVEESGGDSGDDSYGSSDGDDTTDPTDPVIPGEPTEPTDPVIPGEPTEPIAPVTPGEPTEPTDPVTPVDPAAPGDNTEPGSGEGELIYPPYTGDNSRFWMWFWIAIFSVLANIILLWPRRRRNGGRE